MLLNDDLEGRWIAMRNDEKGVMIPGDDESYEIEGTGVRGYYRLWKSNFGDAMTIGMFLPDHGAFAGLQMFERKKDILTLTPIGPDGPMNNQKIQFRLEK